MKRNPPALTPYQSAREWAAYLIDQKFQTMWQYHHSVVHDSGADDLYDMRVASRRLRSVLIDFRACIPQNMYKPLLRSTKKLTEHLGLVRDMDILTERFNQMISENDPSRQSLIDFLIESSNHQRNEGRDHLLRFFHTLEQEQYPHQFEQLISVLRNG